MSPDSAKDLFPDYLSNRLLSSAFQEPAKIIADLAYARLLAEPERRFVEFIMGGTGAGKSTLVELRSRSADAGLIIVDRNLASIDGAKRQIAQAFQAGKRVAITYVRRDPIQAFLEGVIPRSRAQLDLFGSFRPVSIKLHVATHALCAKTFAELWNSYRDKAFFSCLVTTAAGMTTEAIDRTLTEGYDHADVERRLVEAIESQKEAGLPGAIYREAVRNLEG